MTEIKILAKQKVFEGQLIRFSHTSEVNNCEMTASVYLPPIAVSAVEKQSVSSVYWLSGLTCNDQNFAMKAGAFRAAADLNLAIVMPDTSPRGDGVPDDEEGAYDFGLGAGFYVNATQPNFSQHYNMYSYIVEELPALIESNFAVTSEKSISGHSMGGHGALVIGLRNPLQFRSISAFSPICNPINCPWGQKALLGYLGEDKNLWHSYDATSLIVQSDLVVPIKIDQGSDDEFLQMQLKPDSLIKAAQNANVSLEYNVHPGYDHSYFFISSFIDNHLAFHAAHLNAGD